MNPRTDFFIVAREPGAEHPSIPAWASRAENPARLDAHNPNAVERVDIATVPGAFQLTGVLSAEECARLVEMTEALGYLEDAAVSLPRVIRHNHNATWIADDTTNEIIWNRCSGLIRNDDDFDGKRPVGLNSRFRFYRYSEGDYFAPHTDGSWPGSRVIDGELVDNAFNDRWSQLSFVLFLSEDYSGGATQFYVSKHDPRQPARHAGDANIVDVSSAIGTALCFPHGLHPLHCMHSSQEISAGRKYIIRSDVLCEM
ncbi:MAG: oxidoreductase [Gammaproteobacteria bacterium]|nr:oxidoreductase [Gammaproteobacteria bacterium]